jgi:hypothetical protein
MTHRKRLLVNRLTSFFPLLLALAAVACGDGSGGGGPGY